MCVTRTRMCDVYAQCMVHQKKVRATSESVYTPIAHTLVATTWLLLKIETKTKTKKSSLHVTILREYSQTPSKFFLISLTKTWSTSLLSTDHQMCELILLGFPRRDLVLILDDAFV